MIWFDVTEIKNWQGHHTGIQRVISKLGQSLSLEEGFGVCYFDPSTNIFRALEFNFAREVEYEEQAANMSTAFRSGAQKFVSRLKEKSPSKLKDTIKRVTSVGGIRYEAVEFQRGDILFIPGAFWISPFDVLDRLKQQHGVKIVGIMYDLVPLIAPQFTAQVTIEGFGAHFERAVNLFDYWFAISENTKRDMLSISKNMKIGIRSSQVEVIRLGVDDPETNDRSESLAVAGLSKRKFALFVSTVEARKNQALVYQAVRRLKERSVDHYPIVLVGKHGWLSDDIIYILKHDTTIADKLIWLDHVDDRSLRWLYANCAFTVYPSYYEGWGLPVAESLAMGKPCIASNASSVPEVAGDLIEYFSPYSSDELAELIQKYSSKSYLEERAKYVQRFPIPTWNDCAERVMASITSLEQINT